MRLYYDLTAGNFMTPPDAEEEPVPCPACGGPAFAWRPAVPDDVRRCGCLAMGCRPFPERDLGKTGNRWCCGGNHATEALAIKCWNEAVRSRAPCNPLAEAKIMPTNDALIDEGNESEESEDMANYNTISNEPGKVMSSNPYMHTHLWVASCKRCGAVDLAEAKWEKPSRIGGGYVGQTCNQCGEHNRLKRARPLTGSEFWGVLPDRQSKWKTARKKARNLLAAGALGAFVQYRWGEQIPEWVGEGVEWVLRFMVP